MNYKQVAFSHFTSVGLPINRESEYFIFLAYDTSFDWALCSQLSLDLKRLGMKVNVVDISRESSSLPRRLVKRIKKTPPPISVKCRALLEGSQIPIINLKRGSLRRSHALAQEVVSESDFDLKSGYGKLVYPTLVDTFKSLKVTKFTKQRIIEEISNVLDVEQRMDRWLTDDNFHHIVVNGRISRYRAVRLKLERITASLYYLEIGATPNHYQLFSRPPQSELENHRQARALWDLAPPDKIVQAKNYFQTRRTFDPNLSISWSSRMVPGFIPTIDKRKKVCTFYSSSQIEFVEEIDLRQENDFLDQGDALFQLLSILPKDEWQVFLRKHPNRPDSGYFDEENEIWALSRECENLKVIEQDSKVDSFALARASDLIVNFGTSFGAECIYWGLGPVLNLRPTFWTPFVSENSPRNKTQLVALFQRPEITKSLPEAILPWGYYCAIRGIEMKDFLWNSTNGWSVRNKDEKIQGIFSD